MKDIDDFVKQEDIEKHGEIEALHMAGRRYLIYQQEIKDKRINRILRLINTILLAALFFTQLFVIVTKTNKSRANYYLLSISGYLSMYSDN